MTGMQVRFERTAHRRYAVAVLRTRHGNLRLDPAPGYADLIPHDLVRFVVEDEFGLRQGIFGQIAAGGNAGTFVPTEELRTKARARQVQRRNRSTGCDMGRSEDLAAQVYPRWLRQSGHLLGSHLPPRGHAPIRTVAATATAEPARRRGVPRRAHGTGLQRLPGGPDLPGLHELPHGPPAAGGGGQAAEISPVEEPLDEGGADLPARDAHHLDVIGYPAITRTAHLLSEDRTEAEFETALEALLDRLDHDLSP